MEMSGMHHRERESGDGLPAADTRRDAQHSGLIDVEKIRSERDNCAISSHKYSGIGKYASANPRVAFRNSALSIQNSLTPRGSPLSRG
jgi:hypothetical protein